MMFGNSVSQALTNNQEQVLAQSYLDQARLQKTEQHFEVALALYNQAKVAFKNIANTCQVTPIPLSQLKSAFSKAQTSQTSEEETLRERIAEVYFERAKLLEKLENHDKAKASYKKAEAWGYEEIKPSRIARSMSLPASNMQAVIQTAMSVTMPAQQKNVLVDYLFEKALSTLGSLEVSNKPSLFLVYAHDNPTYGQAEASTSKYLIDKLSQIRVKLHSDQAPMAQPYSSSLEDLKEDGKLEDILTSQLCLLPTQLRGDVKPVDKVVVCCSEVLGSYLQWADYGRFYQELREAYRADQEAYRQDNTQSGTLAIREVIRKFSQEQAYKAGFHHVLTEIAFLQIRKEERGDLHGIIPVSLTPNSYENCLANFIPATTVRMEDILRFDEQAKSGREVYPNQSRHWILFKLIERLLVSSNEAKTFLNKFWQGYSDLISRLKNESSSPGDLEFVKLVDSIFDGIRTALQSQLAFTVQQEYQQLQMLNADPIDALKEQYFAAYEQNKAFKEILELYVQPRGKAFQEADTFDLFSKVQELLNTKQVILLTGDSGAGKTTFNRFLEKELWDQKKEHDAIPLFISLASVDKPEDDLIAKALRKRGLSEIQIEKLKKKKQKFVFILDGYDEIRETQNLYLSNGINQPNSWQGHMVISCRSEYLGQDYRSRFQPNPNQQDKDPFFQAVVVEPFSETERNKYLEKYVKHNAMGWEVQRYQEALEQQPRLKELVSNPFLLRVVLEAFPHLESEGKERTAIQLRMDLYDQFIRLWFERGQQRLSTQALTGAKEEVFNSLSDDGFARHGLRFVKDLAAHLYAKNAGNPVVEYSLFKDKGSWKDLFFGLEEDKKLLREAWPLARSGNQYRFIHTSLLEYCVARALFESFDTCNRMVDTRHSGIDVSVYKSENEPTLAPQTLQNVSLTSKHWAGDLGVMRWLTERVLQEPAFKKQLFAIIERSKTDAGVSQVAANAMTILIRAGIQFNGADLQGIQIPGADLSFGVFDHAQLQRADLRKVNLRASWLCHANLREAKMAGVQFGEWPYLQEKNAIQSYAYSQDWKTCAVGLQNGKINLYNTANWEKIYTLRGHKNWVNSVAYSPSAQQIASGSSDNTVRLWNAQSGRLRDTLRGHTDRVSSIAYSPNGKQIASGSKDHTVRLWDTQSGRLIHPLRGHTSSIKNVMYSPNGMQIASGSYDKTVRLWDSQSGRCIHILSGHTEVILSVAFSPNALQIASGSKDHKVHLWDVQSGRIIHTLTDHIGSVNSIAYSPSGKQIASCSDDKTVRLWDVQSGHLTHTLKGHTGSVNSIAYSPSGKQIASCSDDKTVCLWDVQSGQSIHTLSGHADTVLSVAFSPNGELITSRSKDRTVRLWDVQSGSSIHALSGHTDIVSSVAYSSNGPQIVSGSKDQTVRLWDVQSGQPGLVLHGQGGEISSVAYSPKRNEVAFSASGSGVHLWDLETRVVRDTLSGHIGRVNSVVYSPQGDQIASGGKDGDVRLWNVETMAVSRPLSGHKGWAVISIAYSPNGQQIASGSDDKTLRLWDTQSEQPGLILMGHKKGVSSVAYSPNGQQIASGSYDKTVRLWNAQSGQLRRTLCDHTDFVLSVAYSPDGGQLASGSDDKTVRLWDVQSGQCRAVIQDFHGPVTSVAWKTTPDGNYLVTGCADKSVRLWKVIEVRGQTQVRLCWSSTQEVLTVTNVCIRSVQGLSPLNRQLLAQRGAVVES